MLNLCNLILETLNIFESEDIKQLEKERMRLYMKVKNWKKSGKDISELENQLNDAQKRLSDAKKAARLAAKGAIVTPQQATPDGDDSMYGELGTAGSGALDIDKMMSGNDRNIVEASIKMFIRDNYANGDRFDDLFRIRWVDDFPYVDQIAGNSLDVSNRDITSLTNGIFKWGSVKGDFECTNCPNLKSLEGAPEKCNRFNCSYCENLVSLEGVSKTCDKIRCTGCTKLKSLKGVPVHLELLDLEDCVNISSLTELSSTQIRTLLCSGCIKIKNFKGVNAVSIACNGCTGIKSLRYLPVNLLSLSCRNAGLQNLDGMPKQLQYIDAAYNEELTSLKGCSPSLRSACFDGCTGLVDLTGLPTKECNTLSFNECTGLESLKGCPKSLKEISLKKCPNIKNIDDLPRSTKVKGLKLDNF